MIEVGKKLLRQPLMLPTNSRFLNSMTDTVNILRKLRFNRQQFDVHYADDGIQVDLNDPQVNLGYPWGPRWTFGIAIANPLTGYNVVRVYRGKARRYGDQVYQMVPAGTETPSGAPYVDVTFNGDGDGQQIVWQWDPVGGLVVQPNPVTGTVMDDDTYIRGVLSVWNRVQGAVVLVDYQQNGIITLPVYTKSGI